MARSAKQVRRERPYLEAFGIDHAARVTKLSQSRLTRWDRMGFFSPEYIDPEDRGNPYSRIYSYEDLVGLRMIRSLIDDHHVSIAEIDAAYPAISAQWTKPWSQIEIGVLKGKIVTDLKGQPHNVTDGQRVLKCIPLPSIAEEVLREANKLAKRPAAAQGKFDRHKFVMRNATVFRGTRIPLEAVGEFIEAGYTDAAILAEYPSLTAKDVGAARTRLAA